MKLLVAYASRHGATEGIAERIATTLEREGLDVSFSSVKDVTDIRPFDAFVIGSAAYMGGWLGEATTFVRRNRDVLAARPVWLFSSGPIGTDQIDAKGRDVIEASVPKEFAEFAKSIGPRDEQIFFGAFSPDAPPVGMAEGLMAKFNRLAPALKEAMPSGDFRDWPAIEAWAGDIARELRSAEAVAALGATFE
jgi:menaquinone-dependent protoporphyrinogen oxidase